MEGIRAPAIRARDRHVLVAAEVADARRLFDVEATAHAVCRLFACCTAFPRRIDVCRNDGVAIDTRNQVARQVHGVRLWNLRIVRKREPRAHRRARVVGRRRRTEVRKDVLSRVRANVGARLASDHVAMAAQSAHFPAARVSPEHDAPAAALNGISTQHRRRGGRVERNGAVGRHDGVGRRRRRARRIGRIDGRRRCERWRGGRLILGTRLAALGVVGLLANGDHGATAVCLLHVERRASRVDKVVRNVVPRVKMGGRGTVHNARVS